MTHGVPSLSSVKKKVIQTSMGGFRKCVKTRLNEGFHVTLVTVENAVNSVNLPKFTKLYACKYSFVNIRKVDTFFFRKKIFRES